MGVPKFFRWISERYPAISQLIGEARIPEFDCFYLDMNGIIHNCTHSDSDTATTRMSEEAMFRAIFNYLDHLFTSIKPQKLFFMAVDGVAPRAKMNQQRSRRFRTALDAEKAREKAIKAGEVMPTEDPFDSNCITPGTEFMARLSQQLKYFVHKKVSEDPHWQGVEIVLSGHEVPGEGEHKIMEYIRQAKAQPGYEANRRHCLYGLDADLIMLGLLSHDPHFCLLREEVTFGRQGGQKSKSVQHQNFYLLHLCMVREYLELEFESLQEPQVLPFKFDLERVIDDFILMAFFVGNDFLPNLPHLHINEGALALMFDLYKKVLPRAGGYLNEHGKINLERLGMLMDELSHVEHRFFETEYSDQKSLVGFKKAKTTTDQARPRKKNGGMTITQSQKDVYLRVRGYLDIAVRTLDSSTPLPLKQLSGPDRQFAKDLGAALGLDSATPEDDFGDRYLELRIPTDLSQISTADDLTDITESFKPAFRKYDRADVVAQSESAAGEDGDDEMSEEKRYDAAFMKWKDDYYVTKFGWGRDNTAGLAELSRNYIEGLQWVLHYYYQGVASWSWFFRYHYAPMISDVRAGFDANLTFDLGTPFRPFEQLMGVLPDRSKTIVPRAYRDLMTNPESPIIDFYPREFELDMNGKRMEWEAIVKIPFIDQDRLLDAMSDRVSLLTDDEHQRNDFGFATVFTYDSERDVKYLSPLPGVFSDVPHCRCAENVFQPPSLDGLSLHYGLVSGAQLSHRALAGFPTLKRFPFVSGLAPHGVAVFQSESRNQSMVVTMLDPETRAASSEMVRRIGQSVYVGYPFLVEARIVSVSDELFEYVPTPDGSVDRIPHTHSKINWFHQKANRIETTYSKKLAILIGTVDAVVQVEMLKGMKKTDDGAMLKEFAHNNLLESEYPAQLVVDDVFNLDQRFVERAAKPVEEEFPVDSKNVFLGPFAYGQPLRVMEYSADGKIDVELFITELPLPAYSFGREHCIQADKASGYVRLLELAKRLNVRADVLNALVSTVFVRPKAPSNSPRTNLSLNLKFDFHKQKILHYSRHRNDGWEFSTPAIDLIKEYMAAFPSFVDRLNEISRQGRAGSRLFASLIHNPSDLFPDREAAAKMDEIRAWVKSKTNKLGLTRVPLDAAQLDSIQVGILEAAADKIAPVAPKHCVIRNVPRHAILKPADADHRLDTQTFDLGDRVEYVVNTGTVPIGRLGTVVGITRQPHSVLLDVVFDIPFQSGTTLDGRCSQLRGQTVPAVSLLNLTNRQLAVLNKKAEPAAPNPSQDPYSVRGSGGRSYGRGGGSNNSTFQTRDGTIVRPAAAPPSLPGSFSFAVQGGTAPNRGRQDYGRGGNNGGYSGATAGAHNYQLRNQRRLQAGSGQATNQIDSLVSALQNFGTGGSGRGDRGNNRGSFSRGHQSVPHYQHHQQQQQQAATGPAPVAGSQQPGKRTITTAELFGSAAAAAAPPGPSGSGQPQAFNAVPPPPHLTQRGRGRDGPHRGQYRGRGRGRGGPGGEPNRGDFQ